MPSSVNSHGPVLQPRPRSRGRVAVGASRPAHTSTPANDARLADGLSTLAGVASVLLVIRLTEISSITRAVRPMIICGVICLASLVFSGSGVRLVRSISEPSVRAYLLLFVVAAVGVPFGIWPGQSFALLKAVLPFPLILLLTLAGVRAGLPSLDRVLRIFVIGSFAGVLITAGLSSQLSSGGRLSSAGIYDPNDLAALLALTVPISLAVASRSRLLLRTTAYVTAALSAALLLQTGSRGGLIALVIALLVYLLGQARRTAIAILVAVSVATPLGWLVAPAPVRERLLSVFEVENDYNSTSRTGRLAIWRRGATYMRDNPLLGVGLGNFAAAEGETNRLEGTRGAWLNAHNIFVQVGAELGVFGLAAFAYILQRSARLAAKRWSLFGARKEFDRPELLAALASFIVSGMFLSHAYSTLFTFVAGICVLSSSGSTSSVATPSPHLARRRATLGAVRS